MTRALKLRRKLGAYAPIPVAGQASNNALAYARGDVIVVVPRLLVGSRSWFDTTIELPAGIGWRNVMTGDTLPPGRTLLSNLFAQFPVAMLDRG
jgi:maltooligosyltrehalose synthase